jgi:hypothetical protein
MELLFLIAVGFAFRSAWDHAKTRMGESRAASMKQLAKTFPKGQMPRHKLKAASRRHDIGWWAREIGHGLPVTRRGWHAGWIAHQTAAEHHRARLEEAKTSHADAQASVLEALPDHRARQAEAKARRDAILATLKGQPEEAKGSRQAVRDADDELARKRAERQAGTAAVPPLPSDTVAGPQPEPGPYAPRGVVHHDHTLLLPGECPDCGGPGPGVPLVRGDRVSEVRELDGTLVAEDAVVLSNDGERVLLQTPDGRQIDAPSALPLPPTRRPDGKPEDHELSAWLRPGQNRCEHCDGRGCQVCGGWGAAPPDPDGPEAEPGTTCSACGNPGTPDDPVLIDGDTFTHRSHAIKMQQVHAERAALLRGAAAPTAGGDTVTTATAETTYDQQIVAANKIISEAEQDVARLRTAQIAQQVEALATLRLDSGSLDRAAGIDDGIQAQIKAAQQTLDAAQAFRDGLIRDHGAVNEAHQAAPQGGAERDFYVG